MVAQPIQILPADDKIFSAVMLARRWGEIHPKVALQRAKDLGLPIVKFNARSHGVRLSDILRVEQEAMA
jgi:hypothetical protein